MRVLNVVAPVTARVPPTVVAPVTARAPPTVAAPVTVAAPDTNAFPTTCSFCDGAVVPIPTLPAVDIRINSVAVEALTNRVPEDPAEKHKKSAPSFPIS